MINVFELIDFELIKHDGKTPDEKYQIEFSELEKKIYGRKTEFLNNKEKKMLKSLKKGRFWDVFKEINESGENGWLYKSFTDKEVEQMAYLGAAAAWCFIDESNKTIQGFPGTSLYHLIYEEGNKKTEEFFDDEIKKKIITGMLIENLTEMDYPEGREAVKKCLNELYSYLAPEYSTSAIYDLEDKVYNYNRIDLIDLEEHEVNSYKEFIREVEMQKESIYISDNNVGMLIAPIVAYTIEIDKDNTDDDEDEETLPSPSLTISKLNSETMVMKYLNNTGYIINTMGYLAATEILNYMETYTIHVAEGLGVAKEVMESALVETGNCDDWGKILSVDPKLKYEEEDKRSNVVINGKLPKKRL